MLEIRIPSDPIDVNNSIDKFCSQFANSTDLAALLESWYDKVKNEGFMVLFDVSFVVQTGVRTAKKLEISVTTGSDQQETDKEIATVTM